MKKFWKIVLAVVVGMLIVNLLTFLILVSVGSSSGFSQKSDVPSSGILKVDMSKITLAEQSSEDDLLINGFSPAGERVILGLRPVVEALRIAAADPGVKAVYLKTDGTSAGLASLSEFRKALDDFRASGKPVVSYMETPTTGTYYLASVADKVYMTSCEGGTPLLIGVSTQLMFYKDLLDKLGINMQLIRHGKFKSAGEPYIRNCASEANLEQNRVLIGSIWKEFSDGICESRGIAADALDAAIDSLKLCVPSDFVEQGLVDELVSRGQLEDKLTALCGAGDFEDVTMIPFADYVTVKVTPNYRAANHIAVIYADGQIVDGLDLQNVDGDRFASIVEEVRRDSSIKAVVLRVNSPGGSVVASEKIRNELDLLAQVKPLVASYGDYAASGGYWISNGCARIYSDALTITGSIGVFGMVPDLSGLLKDKARVGVESVSSHAHGDMFTMTRPLTPEEVAYMQRSIESIYDKFIGKVAESRSMTPGQVDEIAQGRVWTGADALGIGLVDEIGTLDDALSWTMALAGEPDASKWYIDEYPRPLTIMEQIAALVDGTYDEDYSIRAFRNWYEGWKNGTGSYAFAIAPYRVNVR